MSRRLLMIVMLAQLAFALAVAWLVRRWWPQGGWMAGLAAGLAAVVLVRLGISVNNFWMAWRARSDTPAHHALGPGASLRLFADEFSASMLTSSWHMLFPGRDLYLAKSPADAPPVLLLHGYGCNQGYWAQLAALLRGRGVSHLALDLEPIAGSIDDYAPAIEAALRRLCEATGQARAVIVAHSMGGLAARAHLRRYGADRVARVITLGTPHHGTALADLGPGLNARQMRRGSPWLAELAASESAVIRALFVSFWSHHDNIVAPQDSSFLPGARNVEFGGIGHVALGRHPRILQAVLDDLAQIGR
ncbi:alpha/beta fold hydrolase [Pseudoduganella namucuonensis]|uniref:Triacylglycerol esterase/lipase EstA, alpha/beta hydrolase fold n=1 Tax=Pseudoduganella namucuonensis TaxID=1035707 RepID=A0A1I7J691_9BURK|nr:alpha/beta fold hydrolase [Pseudoduganella namucuonensis]SFU80654.1 Triacylglycerol esterase/lipase EstA, alpha/beta hydrolase fold [Pseudoduganella namucuonensis]